MNEVRPSCALLLDMDGVIVHEEASGHNGRPEVLLLHPDIAACVQQLNSPVFIVTHRSRREAQQILSYTGLAGPSIRHVFTANEILHSALKRGRWLSLVRHGLRKSLILPELSKNFGIDPARLCLVDDRLGNIHDMLDAGLGLGLLAPHTGRKHDTLRTFNFTEVVERFRAWAASIPENGGADGAVFKLAVCRRAVGEWCRTGMDTERASRSVFNTMRGFRRRVYNLFE